MQKRFVLILICATFLSANAYANEGLTLERALQIAFFGNPDMQEARQEIKASSGRWLQAEALPNPEFEIEIGGLKKNEKGKRKGDIGSFGFKQPLDPIGTRFLSGSIAKDDVSLSKKELALVWGEVREHVTDLYYSIVAQSQSIDVARDNLNITRDMFTKVETRHQSGKALRSDVLRAKIEVSEAESELLVAQKDLHIFKSQFNLALGFAIDEGVMLQDTLTYEKLQHQFEGLIGYAFEKRADLQQAEIKVKSAKKGWWRALLKVFLPEMAVGIERTTEEYENNTALTLEASYPLWGFNLGEVKEAKAEHAIQEIRLDTLKRRIKLEVYVSFLEAESADKQVRIRQKALEESRELLKQISTHYQQAELSFLAYLENVKSIKETKIMYLDSLRDYRFRIASLEKAIQLTPNPNMEDEEVL